MDVYDQEILRLADSSGQEVQESWIRGDYLFQFATAKPDERGGCREEYGCLTMIRERGGRIAETPSLTAEIRADERIPAGSVTIYRDWSQLDAEQRVARLQPFAEWQRRLDVEIRGKSIPVLQEVGQ